MGLSTMIRGRWSLVGAGFAMATANITPAAAQDRRLTLPVGTVIPVKLNQSLSSKQNEPGDRFSATVKEGLDDAGLPVGTRVEGVIREALPSRDGKAGVLDVDFRRIILPDGASKSIEGTLYSLNGKDVKRKDGRLVASADKGKDRLKWVGIGAGAGLLISTLTKGNTLFSTLLGAGAGYAYNELSNKKAGDVNLKEGTEFGMRLDRAVDVTVDERTFSRWRDRIGNDRYSDDPRFDERDRDRIEDDRFYRRGDGFERGNDRARERSSPRSRLNRDSDEIGMIIDRREVRFSSAKPFVRNDVVFVPLEPISRAVDVDYRYDAGDKVVRARDGKVRMNVGSRVVFVDGERKIMPAAAEIRNGVVFVPSQFVAWMTNGTSSWDSISRTVIVTSDRDRE
jgi:hypothetical protein